MSLIQTIKTKQYGFLTGRKQLAQLVSLDPHRNLLIRANLGRVVVPAHKVQAECDRINAEQHNWVRDVSLVAGYV